jgi:hypothetical protein
MGERENNEDIQASEAELDAVGIDDLQINDEFKRLPQLIVHANARLSAALHRYLVADLDYDRTKAERFIWWREFLSEEAREDKTVKVTEASITERVTTDPLYFEARMARIEAEAHHVRCKGLVTALLAKKDALVSIGAGLRAEMEGAPSIRRQHRDVHGKDND